MSTEFGKMVATARMGFQVVPIMIVHDEHGMGELNMNGDGLSFRSFDDGWEFKKTWEEFDKGE